MTHPTADELLHFINQSPDLLCIAGFDGIFKRLNPAWQPLLGWANAELQTRPFLDFVHPDDHPAILAAMHQLGAGADTISFENRYCCKDGSWNWIRWTAIRYAATFLADELRQRDPPRFLAPRRARHGTVLHALPGERLHLVASTVDSYRARIKQKLALNNAAELYQRAALWVAASGA